MLVTQTQDKLAALGLSGMAQALQEQLEQPHQYLELSFEDRLGLIVDREALVRDNRAWPPGSRRPGCASAPASRRSTSVPRGGWIAPRS